MIGKRAYPNSGGFLYLGEGSYGFNTVNECWEIRPPGRHGDLLGDDSRVIEHADGSITVKGEILHVDVDRNGQRREWRGTLIHGEWRES